jgi:autotransporter-associated beta strand protein
VYGGVLADGGTSSLALTKIGSGMLTLTGANSYSGGTTVSGGTLQLGAGNSTGLGTGGLTLSGGELDMNTNSVSLPSLSGAAGTISDESVASGTTTLTLTQSTTTAFSGTIRNGLNGTFVALTLDGPGTVILSGTNTYSGGTNVEAGILEVASPTALAGGTSLIVGQGASSLFGPIVPAQAGIPTASAVAPVPEPGTLALLAAGVAFAIGLRRRMGRKMSTKD